MDINTSGLVGRIGLIKGYAKGLMSLPDDSDLFQYGLQKIETIADEMYLLLVGELNEQAKRETGEESD